MKRLALIYLVSLFAFQNVLALEIEDYYVQWYLSGEIVSGDCTKLLSKVKEERAVYDGIYIDSSGGNVREAMCIANFIRENLVETGTTKCASSCLIIWGAGVSRDTSEDSEFGFHRPSFTSQEFASLAPNHAQQKYNQMLEEYKALLLKLDFTTAAIDKMIATKSSDIDIVIGDAIFQYIPEHSPGYQEWEIFKCGETTKKERSDYAALMNLDEGELKHLESDPKYIRAVKSRKKTIEYAKSLSPDYAAHVRKAIPAHRSCVSSAKWSVRQAYFKSMGWKVMGEL